jgi:hypothetical protein
MQARYCLSPLEVLGAWWKQFMVSAQGEAWNYAVEQDSR